MVGMYGKDKAKFCRQMARRFMKKGADINWQNPKESNNTVAMQIIENKYVELLHFVLTLREWNADIERRDGSNALLLAIKHDIAEDVIAEIARRTKNRNVTNKWGENTVQLAKAKGIEAFLML